MTPRSRALLRTSALAWLASRAVVAIAAVGVWIVESTGRGPYPTFDRGLFAWDGDWYRLIAEHGYGTGGEEIRFFPLYPWLGRALGAPLGSEGAGLLIVANASALVAGLLIGAVTLRATDRPMVAHRTIWLVMLWPASFVLVFAYSEALFLVLTAWVWLAARDRRWIQATVAGCAAGATRPTGLALTVLVALLAAPGWSASDIVERLRRGAAIAAPVGGFVLVGLVAADQHGAFRGPIDTQDGLRGDLVDPFRRFATGIGDAFGAERFGDGLHLPFAVVAVAGVVLVARHVGRAEALYAGLIVLVAISADNWNSLERYTLNAFPVMIGFAAALSDQARERWWWTAIASSSVAMIGTTTLAWTGDYVP